MFYQLTAANTLALRMLLIALEEMKSGSLGHQYANVMDVKFSWFQIPSSFKNIELTGRLENGWTFRCTCAVRKYVEKGWRPISIDLRLYPKGEQEYHCGTLAGRFREVARGEHAEYELVFNHQPLDPVEATHFVSLTANN